MPCHHLRAPLPPFFCVSSKQKTHTQYYRRRAPKAITSLHFPLSLNRTLSVQLKKEAALLQLIASGRVFDQLLPAVMERRAKYSAEMERNVNKIVEKKNW